MTDPFASLAGWLSENALVPVLYRADMMQWEDIAYGWLLFAIYGVAQIAVMLAICVPLERWRRLEHWPDSKAVGVDILYTLISRIGVMPLVTFVLFYEAQVWVSGTLTDAGYVPPTLERLMPFLMGRQMLTFCLYVLILDCADYWRHRLSHCFGWWYALHAVHHAQRQMSFWSDDRNHVLDDIAAFVWFFAIGLLIGIPPMQFPLVILLLRTLESISHANARVSFGWLGERLLVSPRFHRAHHGVLAAGQRSCNYGAIFPLWDMLFGTADFSRAYVRTGDPSAEEAMASGGWWAQQVAGVRRLWKNGVRTVAHGDRHVAPGTRRLECRSVEVGPALMMRGAAGQEQTSKSHVDPGLTQEQRVGQGSRGHSGGGQLRVVARARRDLLPGRGKPGPRAGPDAC